MNLLEKCRAFINSDVKEENEPKETAVLVRVLSIIDIVYILIDVVFLFSNHGIKYGSMALVILGMLAFTLALSYKVTTHAMMGLYFLTIVVCSGYFTICFGVAPMYHIQMFTVFLIYFYRSAESTFSRTVSVVATGAISLVTVFYVISHGPRLTLDSQIQSVLIIVNTTHILMKLALVAYFFRIKFSATETKLIQYSRKLEMIATTDPLTKLQNRRGMFTYLERLVEDHHEKDFALTLGIGDIDFFKKINDTYGHEAGDYVLETLSKLMNEFMKDHGLVARWGGEEFLFAFEGINGDYAFESLSKLLHIIERYEFSYNNIDFKVTMTFGLEEYDEREGIEKTISKADEKLYMGKEAGRDRVIF